MLSTNADRDCSAKVDAAGQVQDALGRDEAYRTFSTGQEAHQALRSSILSQSRFAAPPRRSSISPASRREPQPPGYHNLTATQAQYDETTIRINELAAERGVEEGNALLGSLFSSKEVSRTVAQHASAETGVGADKLKALLSILAAFAAGAMAKRSGGGASLGRLLG